MEEINLLKIETVTHLFSKFMRMQGTCLTHACITFFARTDMWWVAHPTTWLEWARRVGPGRRGGRPGLPLTI
jgi:hypothetical protein